MPMSRFLSTFVIAAALTASCGGNPTSPETTFPVTATLQPGETTMAGGLSVKFVGVTQDSRCPAAAICIVAGDANLQFELSTSNGSAGQQLQVEHPDNKHTTFQGYSVEVQGLAPYPITFNSIKPEDYRVTVKVDR